MLVAKVEEKQCLWCGKIFYRKKNKVHKKGLAHNRITCCSKCSRLYAQSRGKHKINKLQNH